MKVTVIDYGLNNLLSICRAFEHLGATVKIATKVDECTFSDRIVLPGVGAFPDGMMELNRRGLSDFIREAYTKGYPILGICLGMQMLLKTGFEINECEGIGILNGTVRKLPENLDGHKMKVPHVNWNRIIKPENTTWDNTILQNNNEGDFMYFVHSFFVTTEDPGEVLAVTPFGKLNFTSAFHKNNCWGTQFHPEKSGTIGLKILQRFLNQ